MPGSDLGALHFVLMTIAGVVWHFWISVPLVVITIVSLVASMGSYLQKVTYKRYPRD